MDQQPKHEESMQCVNSDHNSTMVSHQKWSGDPVPTNPPYILSDSNKTPPHSSLLLLGRTDSRYLTPPLGKANPCETGTLCYCSTASAPHWPTGSMKSVHYTPRWAAVIRPRCHVRPYKQMAITLVSYTTVNQQTALTEFVTSCLDCSLGVLIRAQVCIHTYSTFMTVASGEEAEAHRCFSRRSCAPLQCNG